MKRLICILTCFITCAGAAEKLDIDRLYSLPWLIGTAPKGFVWSADSKTVAFLWNDEGTNFRDVWIATRENARPVRVTRMPRPQVLSNNGNDLEAMQRAADAEMDPGVSAVLWSPDQTHLLFLLKGKLYSVRPEGGEPVLLTDRTNIRSVVSAPAGNKIAFQSAGEVFIASVTAAGPATEVKRVGSGSLTVEDMVWSHNGRMLAFTETDDSQVPRRGIPDYLGPAATLRMVKRPFPGEPSERRRVGFVTAGEEGQIRWAKLGGDPLDIVFHMAWSPDDKTLLVDKSDLYIKDRRLLLVDARNGNASELLRETDPQNVTDEWWADWAPDGRGVYFTSDRENFYQVYYAPLRGAVRRVTSGRAEISWASLNVRTNALFYLSNEGRPEERQLHKVSLADSADTQITHAAGTHTVAISPDGSIAADAFSSDLIPPDLYFQKIDSPQSPLQVTHSPLPEFTNYRWVGARYVTFPSTVDGVTLHGRLTLPPDFDPKKRYPAILGSVYSNTVHNQWGGRVAHPTWGLDQYLAQQGYILLNVDIRGSLGYGKAFRQKLALGYGGIDVEDLYSGAKFLGTLGYVDMARVGIWGSSYGGLLTTTALFTKPGVFKAGVAGAPATSLFHALTGEMRTMMAPQDHQQEFAKASAFLKSAGLADHLMIIHGMRDEIVLFQDSVTLEQRLILQGKDVQLVPLPNSPHSWDTGPMAQTRFAFHQLISFFQRYLGDQVAQ
jgi:dipeptidyl-peptidase-4